MSDSDEENYCFFGKALDQYDADSFPKKKPIPLEDQIATDEQGRRRFHGAFTGGFSAGFFNSVGSLEGWRPTEFKSSRSEKAEKKVWKPEDYMDTEDTAEFGIAPQTVKATSDYSTSKKRKKQVFSDGPIPGEPVLHTLITGGNETIGYLLMKNMSLKHRREQIKTDETKTYGCVMPNAYEIKRNTEDEANEIPEIYSEYLKSPKANTFGLGYVGLAKSHINLFQPTHLVVHDKNKKLSISGQAFGVGAFEDDDEDIYTKDDMMKYDFELTAEAKKKERPATKIDSVFDIFHLSRTPLQQAVRYSPPVIPHSFSGKHNVKKSRFEPIPEPKEVTRRKNMSADVRAKQLGEDRHERASSQIIKELEVPVKKESESGCSSSSELLLGKFVSATLEENPHDILAAVPPSETEHGTQEMRDAAKLNMYGPLTRIIADWKPCSLLCKRFNVPEPVLDLPVKNRRKKNPLIFEYQKDNVLEPILTTGLQNMKPAQAPETNSPIETVSSTNEQVESVEASNQSVPTIPLQEKILNKENSNVPEDTDKIDVSKNLDLFRAVFLSSSESESEDEEKKEEETHGNSDTMQTNDMLDNLIPKIKTNKQGILSNIKHTFNPLPRSKKNTSESDETVKNLKQGENQGDRDGNVDNVENDKGRPGDPYLYGPKLPEKINPVQNVFLVPKAVHSQQEWIEKDEANRKKAHKHKKKHKKEKHKKKKHKSTSRK